MIFTFKMIHYRLQMCLTILEINVFNIWTWSCSFSFRTWISMASMFKKDRSKVWIIYKINILLMVEKEIRGGICHAIHRYAKADNKYMKNYDKNKESSYLMCFDANNLYEWAMSQKLPVNGFEWKKMYLNLTIIS